MVTGLNLRIIPKRRGHGPAASVRLPGRNAYISTESFAIVFRRPAAFVRVKNRGSMLTKKGFLLTLLLSLWPSLSHPQDKSTLSLPNLSVLRDIRYFVQFDPNDNLSPAEVQDCMRGVRMGLNLWETTVPDLHVLEAATVGQANFIFIFKDFGTVSDPIEVGGFFHGTFKSDGSPEAVSDPNDPLPNIPLRIYINTHYPISGVGNRNLPSTSGFDYISRQQVYTSYIPATNAPSYWNVDRSKPTMNPGFVDGRFSIFDGPPESAPLVGKGDLAHMIHHEFGHCLGLEHPGTETNPEKSGGGTTGISAFTTKDLVAWYGNPIDPATGAKPAQPFFDANTSPQYAGVTYPFYGGGTCNVPTDPNSECPMTGGALQPWIQNLRYSQIAGKMNAMFYGYYTRDMRPAGIPLPPSGNNFNARAIFPGDVFLLTETYRTVPHTFTVADNPAYPWITGTIRLTKASGEAFVTSNWSDALAKAQLNAVDQQADPFFVTGVYASTNAHSRLGAGYQNTLVVRSDGSVYAAGLDDKGQLGNDATLAGQPTPIKTAVDNSWIAVDGGEKYNVLVRNDGSLWAAGSNNVGQLGVGNLTDQPNWVTLATKGWASVSAGSHHTLGLKTDGTVYGWGGGWEGELDGVVTNTATPVPMPIGNNAIAVSAGAVHSLVLNADGTVTSWGANDFGQCGQNAGMGATPRQAGLVRDASNIPLGGIIAVSAGFYHSLALSRDGIVWAWGYGEDGELGQNSLFSSPYAKKVFNLDNVVAISAGSWHNLALKNNGSLVAWGLNTNGQLGNGSSGAGQRSLVPAPVGTASDWFAIAAGDRHSLAMKRSGSTYSWGENSDGRLGQGTTGLPVAAPTQTKITYCSVSLSSPVNNTALNTPTALTLTAAASGGIRRVDFFENSIKIGEVAASPYSMPWTSGIVGNLKYTAKLVDRYGITKTTSAATVSIKGMIKGSSQSATGALAFFREELDWAHWGYSSATSYNHLIDVTPLITNITHSGTVTRKADGSLSFGWSNGTPLLAPGLSPACVSVAAVGNFLQFTVKVPVGKPQWLRVWVGAEKANGTLTVTLDDASGAKYTNTLSSPLTDSSPRFREYTIGFASSSTGRTLTVNWKLAQLNVTSGGHIRLYAASLSPNYDPAF
jgi:alpha-tubulin suppressor-like RCC1 family protein